MGLGLIGSGFGGGLCRVVSSGVWASSGAGRGGGDLYWASGFDGTGLGDLPWSRTVASSPDGTRGTGYAGVNGVFPISRRPKHGRRGYIVVIAALLVACCPLV